MVEYRDPITGYMVRRYTEGPERNAKLYFSTENFSTDDKYFYFGKNQHGGIHDGTYYRAEVATGEITPVIDDSFTGLFLDWNKNVAYAVQNGYEVYAINLDDNSRTKVGELPKGGRISSRHITVANTGRIACSCILPSQLSALIILDPGKECEIVHLSDTLLGHVQICPTDENLLFYIHETGGDALQRTWMFDVPERYKRPYYVEHPREMITHETWSADGSEVVFIKIPGELIIGDKDGRHFDVAARIKNALHPAISRDRKWLVADISAHFGPGIQPGVALVERATGKQKFIASTGHWKTSSNHQHPSFNRAGDMVLFNNPDPDGTAQVCTIDLKQVMEDW